MRDLDAEAIVERNDNTACLYAGNSVGRGVICGLLLCLWCHGVWVWRCLVWYIHPVPSVSSIRKDSWSVLVGFCDGGMGINTSVVLHLQARGSLCTKKSDV